MSKSHQIRTKHNIHLAIKIYSHQNPSTTPDLVRIEPFKRKAAFESDWAEVSRYPHDEEIYVHIRKALLIWWRNLCAHKLVRYVKTWLQGFAVHWKTHALLVHDHVCFWLWWRRLALASVDFKCDVASSGVTYLITFEWLQFVASLVDSKSKLARFKVATN